MLADKIVAAEWSDEHEKMFVNHLKSSIKFDLGDAEIYHDGKGTFTSVAVNGFKGSESNEALVNLPYSQCFFEMKTHSVKHGLLCLEVSDSIVITCLSHCVAGGEVSIHPYGFAYKLCRDQVSTHDFVQSALSKEKNIDYEKVRGGVLELEVFRFYSGVKPTRLEIDDDYDRIGQSQCEILNGALHFMNTLNQCSNVFIKNNTHPAALQKKRLKKGKLPLFEYKTLHVRPRNTDGKSKGTGTHASPRLHLRRGHIRRYKDGKKIWVQPCMVGNKKLGVVHKDYVIHVAN